VAVLAKRVLADRIEAVAAFDDPWIQNTSTARADGPPARPHCAPRPPQRIKERLMETRAHHVLIGLHVLVALAALLFCLWLTKSGRTATSTTTSDLQRGGQRSSRGSPVQYSGIKVGDVVGLSLDPADPRKVRARIRVTGRRPSRKTPAPSWPWPASPVPR
jgi:hypothetical protein